MYCINSNGFMHQKKFLRYVILKDNKKELIQYNIEFYTQYDM